jgi:hypothetical protein
MGICNIIISKTISSTLTRLGNGIVYRKYIVFPIKIIGGSEVKYCVNPSRLLQSEMGHRTAPRTGGIDNFVVITDTIYASADYNYISWPLLNDIVVNTDFVDGISC